MKRKNLLSLLILAGAVALLVFLVKSRPDGKNDVKASQTQQQAAASEQQETEQHEAEQAAPASFPGPAGPGVFTFYNEASGKYLSCSGDTLILSETPVNWNLTAYTGSSFYIYANGTDRMLDVDNAVMQEGTGIKLWTLTGYDVQLWEFAENPDGTYTVVSHADNAYCLGFDNGNAVLQLRRDKDPAQEWKLAEITDSGALGYRSYFSDGGIIELRLPTDIETVISGDRLRDWADNLETAYGSYYELTGFLPYERIVVNACESFSYAGYVLEGSNIIHIDRDFLFEDLSKMAAREVDWNFCALHEMGHMFDSERPWCFETEMTADLKLAYVLERNGASAEPAEFDASTCFYGSDIVNAYESLGSDFSAEYDIYGCAARFLRIKEDVGWQPFIETFHYMQENEAAYAGISGQEMFETFVELLSGYSGKDVRAYFTADEWDTVIRKTQS